MIALQVANDGFDGGATAHLAANGLGDTPDLAGDPDLEPVRMVVAAIALVAVDAADRNTCELFEIGDGIRGLFFGSAFTRRSRGRVVLFFAAA